MHRYALQYRSANPGTVPRGFSQLLPRPAAGDPWFDVARHGIICYEWALSPEQTKAFELPEILGLDRHPEIVALLVKELQEYARGYLRMAIQEPENFENVARARLRSNWAGYPPVVADFASVVQALVEGLKQAHEMAQAQAARQAEKETAARIGLSKPAEPEPGRWFAVTDMGTVIALKELHASKDSADESLQKQGINALWLIDEATAREWQTVIGAHLDTPKGQLMPSAQSTPGDPRVLITVRGGVAGWVSDSGVDVEVFDFDDCANCDGIPGCTRKLPAHFSDLAQAVDAAYEGDGHNEGNDDGHRPGM